MVRLNDGVQLNRSADIEIRLTGIQGTCQNTLQFKIPLTAQTNDNIADATEIMQERTGPTPTYAPLLKRMNLFRLLNPVQGSFHGAMNTEQVKNIVEKSVWFHFTPTANQTITFYSTGLDNQIAIYRASTYQDVLSGNYTLVGANDDYTDADYNPRITSINVSAGQKYWVQVDGSGGGVTGTFYLTLSVQSDINDASVSDEEIKVYPLPAEDIVTIESRAFTRCSSVKIELIDYAGRDSIPGNIFRKLRVTAGSLYTIWHQVFISPVFSMTTRLPWSGWPGDI